MNDIYQVRSNLNIDAPSRRA